VNREAVASIGQFCAKVNNADVGLCRVVVVVISKGNWKLICFFLSFPGGRIVSSKPFAPLNFRINSRNLSGTMALFVTVVNIRLQSLHKHIFCCSSVGAGK